MMDIRAIRTEADLDWALAEIEPYFACEPAPGSADAERFDVLTALINDYESRHWNIDSPEPIDALKAFMEMRGFKQTDLAALLGSRSRASEVLARRRALTLEMIHRISSHWHLPADLLVKPYALAQAS
jgi:HTH-type transcriptional regulator / antitoxin HigA